MRLHHRHPICISPLQQEQAGGTTTRLDKKEEGGTEHHIPNDNIVVYIYASIVFDVDIYVDVDVFLRIPLGLFGPGLHQF